MDLGISGRTALVLGAGGGLGSACRRLGARRRHCRLVAFLAGARTSYITGSIIRVDGGYIASI